MAATIRVQLGKLPPVEDPQYEFKVTDLVELHHDRAKFHELSEDSDERIAFNALFAELSLLWRDRDFAQYRARVAESRGRYRDQARFLGCEAQACGSRTDVSSLRSGRLFAQRALADLPDRPGILHTLAQIIASLAEQGHADELMLDEAEDAVRQAISLEPKYAKYQATLARILLHEDRYKEAMEAVTEAIELESSAGPHYALRVGDYQDVRMAITFGEASDKLNKQHEAAAKELQEARADLEEQRTLVFQLLGLLAAVIAFIVTGVQVARDQKLSDAAGLMILIASSTVTVFAGFRLLFPGREGQGDVRAYVLLVGGLVIAAGVWGGAQWG
ncbi:MAG TPA: hypothetical protein VGG08_01150 [Solirubrobacteraceae bacterium]|jgi:tetratricopeptide (TPR) repeat protein